MTAIERSFAEPPPPHLYFDTNFALDYLIEARPNHDHVVPFVQQLMQVGITNVYVSSISWIDFTHAIRPPSFRNALPRELREALGVDRWEQDPEVRRRYLAVLVASFEHLLDHFAWDEVPVTPGIRRQALALIAKYNLGDLDAIHLASAFDVGVVDLSR